MGGKSRLSSSAKGSSGDPKRGEIALHSGPSKHSSGMQTFKFGNTVASSHIVMYLCAPLKAFAG
eukprot:6476482-Amphidinium_carterae.2